jgi:hypothetical protein
MRRRRTAATQYALKPRDKPVDYALLPQRAPQLFVEAKALNRGEAE